MATDWLFYEEMARDLMRDAYRYDADTKNLKDKEVRRYAKQINVDGKTLLVAYRNVKYKFDPASEFV